MVSVFAIAVASIAFMYLRVGTYELDPDEPHSLREIIASAEYVYETKNYSEILDRLQENAQLRGFILSFLADLLSHSTKSETGYGRDAANGFILAVPSFLWPSKTQNFPPVEEELANQLFGTAYPDQANSLLTAGVVDFGLMGALIYPVAAAAAVTLLFRVIVGVCSPFIAGVIVLAGVYFMLNAEVDFTGYVILIRNSIIFALLLYTGLFVFRNSTAQQRRV